MTIGKLAVGLWRSRGDGTRHTLPRITGCLQLCGCKSSICILICDICTVLLQISPNSVTQGCSHFQTELPYTPLNVAMYIPYVSKGERKRNLLEFHFPKEETGFGQVKQMLMCLFSQLFDKESRTQEWEGGWGISCQRRRTGCGLTVK